MLKPCTNVCHHAFRPLLDLTYNFVHIVSHFGQSGSMLALQILFVIMCLSSLVVKSFIKLGDFCIQLLLPSRPPSLSVLRGTDLLLQGDDGIGVVDDRRG